MVKTTIYIVVGIMLWFTVGIIGSGFGNANLRAEFPRKEHYWSDSERAREARKDCGFAISMSIAGPMNLITSAIISGLGASGWSLSCTPVPR